jgi:predicted MPP superfamily phosphohydrolase
MSRFKIITFIIVVLIILGFFHRIIYEGLVIGLLITDQSVLSILPWAMFFFSVSFIISTVLAGKWNTWLTRLYYRLSVLWLGFGLYIFIASVIYLLYLLIAPAEPRLMEVLLLIAGIVGLYGLYNAANIKIRTEKISLPGLPVTWRGRRAVFISDLHLGQVRGRRFTDKIVAIIKTINPDILLIGGDVYDGVKVDALGCVLPFKTILPSLGSYFIMGNHEEFFDNSQYRKAIESVGIRILNNEAVSIDGVQLAGVDYKTTETAEDFKNVLEKINLQKNQPSILLKHVPLHIEVAKTAGISLQLSGHTHQAQVFPFNLLTPVIFKGFDYGLKQDDTLQVCTSSGVGTWGPPFRVGTHSEIVVIEFV